jgi:hypothetical protein
MGLRSVPITFAQGNWIALWQSEASAYNPMAMIELTKFNGPNPSPGCDVKNIMNTSRKIFDRSIV